MAADAAVTDALLEHWLRCHEIFEADKPQLERVHVIRYEDLVREPEPVLRGVFEFLELDPIPPSEPVEAGADERYFAQWQALKRDPRMRAYLDLVVAPLRAARAALGLQPAAAALARARRRTWHLETFLATIARLRSRSELQDRLALVDRLGLDVRGRFSGAESERVRAPQSNAGDRLVDCHVAASAASTENVALRRRLPVFEARAAPRLAPRIAVESPLVKARSTSSSWATP